MKKITINFLILMFFAGTSFGFSQTLNQPASWPNTGWTLTGTFNPAALLSDPTVTGTTFTFDDDAAGNGSADALEVTSPVIDLTAASVAGETWIRVSGDYIFRSLGESLLIETYDADAMTWSALQTFTGNSTNTDFQTCASTAAYTSAVLDISGFTATQLSGFQYRISYDDMGGWQWGFCLTSPTITSEAPPSCGDVSAVSTSNAAVTTVDVAWTDGINNDAFLVEVYASGESAANGDTAVYSNAAANGGSDSVTGLMAGTAYDVFVTGSCAGTSTAVVLSSFTTINLGEGCAAPISATVEADCSTATPFTIDFATAPNIGGTGTCDASGDNRGFWYEFTAPASGTVSISNGGASNEIVILDACGGTEVVCGGLPDNTDTTIGGLTPAAVYKMAIWKDSFLTLTTDDFCIEEITCTAPTFDTATIVESCNPDGSGTFTVDIIVTDAGDGNSVIDDGITTYAVTVGTITIGPYNSGDSIDTLLDNTADDACDFVFGTFTFTCPQPPPANDDCASAIVLTPGAVFTENPIVGSNAGATGSGETPLPSCSSYDPADATGFGGDVWYSVVVPADGNLTIEVDNNGGPSTDSGMQVYSGTCGSLVAVACDDDGGNGNFSQVVIESADGLAGETLLVRVFEYGGNSEMNFLISAFSATLSTTNLENQAAFTYFPNPVKNTLTLNAQNTIENVVMYNMLGQQVLRVMPNTIDSELDMSNLQTGTYFVKVTIANVTKTIRVIKQ